MGNVHMSAVTGELAKSGISALLVSQPANIFYLTGFQGISPHEREALVLVTVNGITLIVPQMYAEQAEKLSTVKDGSVTIDIDSERDGLWKRALASLTTADRLAIEPANIRVSELQAVRELFAGTIRVDLPDFFTKLRVVKDAEELTRIQRVVHKTDQVFIDLVKHLRTSKYLDYTELDVADLLRTIGRAHGVTSFAFEPIVACGVGSSQPHYATSQNTLKNGSVLLMDFGFTLDGYHSDLTRTICLGNVSDRVRTMYDHVYQCNRQSIAHCRPGVETGELQQQAIRFFDQFNVGTFFIHGLGHGIGLEVHEEPYFRLHRKTPLRPGMVVTIEPGLYFPGEFGIRIEDYVQIGDDDAIVLSSSPRELIQLS